MRRTSYKPWDVTVVLDLDHTLLHTQDDMSGYDKALKICKEEDPLWRRRLYCISFAKGSRTSISKKALDNMDKLAKSNFVSALKQANMWGVLRPGAIEFYEYCFENFSKVVVWSAGSRDYVYRIVELFQNITGKYPHLVWTYDDLDHKENGYYYKDLHKMAKMRGDIVGGISRMIIIDDTAATFCNNVENAIHIPAYKFKGDYRKAFAAEDDAFEKIKEWMETYCGITKDIRKAPKDSIF